MPRPDDNYLDDELDHEDDHDEDEDDFEPWDFRPYDETFGKFAVLCGLFFFLVVPLFRLASIAVARKTVHYRVDEDEITITSGVTTQRRDNLRYERITDVAMERTLVERLLGTGSIILETRDVTEGRVVMRGVPDVEDLYADLKDVHGRW